MLKDLLLQYEHVTVKLFGYNFMIHFEELILVLAGICLGGIIVSFFAGHFIKDLYHIDDCGKSKLQMVRVTKESNSKYIINVRNFAEGVEEFLLLSFSPLFTVKQFTKRDEKRTKRFLIVMSIITIVLLIFAIIECVNKSL